MTPYSPIVNVSITGSFQGNAVASCAYNTIFNDPVAAVPMTLVTTPGCIGVDQIAITDHLDEDFFVDDMQIILSY